MDDERAAQPGRAPATGPAAEPWVDPPNWGRRIVVAMVAVLGGLLAYVIGAAVLPRWWAQRVGDFVDGGITVGATLGVFVGFVFTLLPLVVLAAAFRWRGSWRRWVLFLVAALLVAAPNLMTLGIVAGDGSAAHAGERILDVDGPGFRGGTLVGVLLGAAVFAVFAYLVLSRRSTRRRVTRMEDEHAAAAAGAAPPAEPPPAPRSTGE
jgi:hypothetical protein